ncbi:MAG: tRNA pseudouridine(38-40) synthase TruA [Chloroflexi bacterium]|nr:tRNA pseudouridine(38-40) synthase TruA [Chloroflexota bacterium]
MAANYRAVLEYDGTNYAGFQVQAELPTIQGTVEAALHKITGEAVRIAGAGRTDAGVHARGQVISFRCGWRHSAMEMQRALNALLPADIAVRELAPAADDFHARYSAIRRTYIYNIYQDTVRSPLRERYAWHIAAELDVAAMQMAATSLLGATDCAAFGQDPRGGESTMRWIYSARWQAEAHTLGFELTADAFLRGMVRRIVGNLVQVGLGQMTAVRFSEIQRLRSPAHSAPPAPARGLCLWFVQYQDDGHCAQGSSMTQGVERENVYRQSG